MGRTGRVQKHGLKCRTQNAFYMCLRTILYVHCMLDATPPEPTIVTNIMRSWWLLKILRSSVPMFYWLLVPEVPVICEDCLGRKQTNKQTKKHIRCPKQWIFLPHLTMNWEWIMAVHVPWTQYQTIVIYRQAWATNWDPNKFNPSMIYMPAELPTETLSPKGLAGYW